MKTQQTPISSSVVESSGQISNEHQVGSFSAPTSDGLEDFAAVAESRGWPIELVALIRAYQNGRPFIEHAAANARAYWRIGFDDMIENERSLGSLVSNALSGLPHSFLSDARTCRDVYASAPLEAAEHVIKGFETFSVHTGSQTDWRLVEKVAHPVASKLREINAIVSLSRSEFDQMFDLARSGRSIPEVISTVMGPVIVRALELFPLFGRSAYQAAFLDLTDGDIEAVRESLAEIEQRLKSLHPEEEVDPYWLQDRQRREKEAFLASWVSQFRSR